eukprot:4767406-Pyramimonas_sp.AAC.1
MPVRELVCGHELSAVSFPSALCLSLMCPTARQATSRYFTSGTPILCHLLSAALTHPKLPSPP